MVQFKYRCVACVVSSCMGLYYTIYSHQLATCSAYINVHFNMGNVFLTCDFVQLHRALKPLLPEDDSMRPNVKMCYVVTSLK